MKYFLFAFSLVQLIFCQDIFDSFGLDEKARYSGETVYQIDIDRNTLLVLNMHNISGDITISGDDGATVQVVEKMKIYSPSKRKARQAYGKIKARIHYDDVNGIIDIIGSYDTPLRFDLDYNVRVPKQTSVFLVNQGGDIDINNVAGELNLSTAGGDIDLAQLAGKIQANTKGGDIDIRHAHGNITLQTSGGDISSIDTEGILSLTTFGGDLDVELNRGNVTLFTSGGEIEISTIEGHTITAESNGGDIDVNDITADITLKTSGGDIYLEDVLGNITAETQSGDIELDNVSGDIIAETGSGTIQIENAGGRISAVSNHGDISVYKVLGTHGSSQDIDLNTRYGDVYVILPSSFQARFSITVTGTESRDAVETFFPIDIQYNGMVVKASGILGAEQNTVRIESHFGRVIINKD
ncbi:MAG: DUF4097 domain-containing protein [Fidelibacterota bacterium]